MRAILIQNKTQNNPLWTKYYLFDKYVHRNYKSSVIIEVSNYRIYLLKSFIYPPMLWQNLLFTKLAHLPH